MSKVVEKRRKRIRRALFIDIIILVAVIVMFITVKIQNHNPFSYKGDYKSLELKGTWYKVNVDDIYTVTIKSNGDFVEKDSDGKITNKGTYKIGDHAIKINQKSYPMNYTDEEQDIKDATGDKDMSQYEVTKYFYITDSNNDIYYFNSKEAAANLASDNCTTNAYYKKTEMVDDKGFVIDGDDTLLAYMGNESEVTIPDTVTTIGENAFSADYDRAVKVDKVTVPSTVKKISSGAFAFSKVKKLYIEQGIEEIDTWAFGDSEMKEIHLPSNVSTLQEGIFQSEEGLLGMKIYCRKNSSMDNYLKSNPPKGDYEIAYE